MPKFAANLTMLFNEVDFMERFQAAARAGFQGVEYLFPYAYSKESLGEPLERHSLKQVLHNLPAGDWEAGERGIACHPKRIGEFQDGVGQAIEYATALGCPQVNCLAGIIPNNEDPDRVQQTLTSNLQQYDIYHMQVMEGDLTNTIEREMSRIGHIQVADNPGRHEPGTGEINYPYLFRRLDELGYDGWVGCEYKPTKTTGEGLAWLRPYQS